ncbi:heterogeneous nuclear ribonucleoprotein 1-like [Pyrus ussuriensis x Pyrus communis]|uniref:Heterogeneous nuclear ribonucleoprotein 1-like n=1 Tax=Pyrus ussuriensis x Pyrus communis TaxID=2448454 RepID=A0A5N5GQ52_9ROSA|nr:heterogeneous nuclear ribonucleoprotein 1-like [Pyrus ussuriensis x Pyrus communis]
MEPLTGKLFVANLPNEFTETTVKEYFTKYGEVKDCAIIVHKVTRNPRGFGFVSFTDPSVAENVMGEGHIILGRKVDVKTASPNSTVKKQNQEDQHAQSEPYYNSKRIFVGGLPHNLTQEEFKNYFEKFDTVTDAVIICCKESGKSRGFGFITFESEEAVDDVLQNKYHELNDKFVEVKRAQPMGSKKNPVPTHDCNRVVFDYGRRPHRFANSGNFFYSGVYCISCLCAYEFGHLEGCRTLGYLLPYDHQVYS